MFQMDAPDVSYDLIPEHITALLFICHIPEFTHFIMQICPDWYEGFVQFQVGGNFVCLCECEKQKIQLAHILGTQNFFGLRWWPASGRSFKFLFKPNRRFNCLSFPLGILLRILLAVLLLDLHLWFHWLQLPYWLLEAVSAL
jgi:hypothetical protein